MTVRSRVPFKEGSVPELTKYLLYCFDVDCDPLSQFGNISEEEVQARLTKLWKIHRVAALKHFIELEGSGYRPATFWRVECPTPRPEIVYRGGSPGPDPYSADRELVRRQRIDVLYRNGLLTKTERLLLAETEAADFGHLSKPE